MPATTTDIQAGTRRAKIETWSSATIKTRYPSARDGAAEAAEGMFDSATDADTALAQRAALLGTERRHFVIDVADLVWPDPAGTGIPIVALTDPEQGAAGLKTIAIRIEVDCGAETTSYEVFG
jgi:hypothetical protein